MGHVVTLDSKLSAVVGARAKKLETAFGMETVRDLLHHLPRRYQERGELTDLAELVDGEFATVWARVTSVKTLPPRTSKTGGILRITKVGITDGRESMELTFFNQPWRNAQLGGDKAALFAGKVSSFRGTKQLTNPETHVVDGPDDVSTFANSVIPIYPATSTVASWTTAQAVRLALDMIDWAEVDDPMPDDVRARHHLPTLEVAYRLVHQPESLADQARGRIKLAWDEALLVQTVLAQRRVAAERIPAASRRPVAGAIADAFDARLPFTLTRGQREIGELVAGELAREHPMHRLLQGEVGSGKTLVAARAMLQVIDAGGQAALLAPTEVLAQQHARALGSLLGELGRAGELDEAEHATRLTLLTGSLTAGQRRTALEQIRTGTAGLVIGTHALLEPTVEWADLGLVVVDEQHRFGVEQRDALRQRSSSGRAPHVLVMTATPIPRTVAMTVFGDLEVSTLTELPTGRLPIKTSVVPSDAPAWVARMWGKIREEVAGGHRAYIVCPRIEAADPDEQSIDGPMPQRSPAAAVEEIVPLLAEGELRGLRVAALHGRLTPEVKDATMQSFARGDLDVLVATTVIEVGVDVPQATVMVVLDADRFGVSQLHQLRGRVGRGADQSWCLLHTTIEPGTPARGRLDAVASTLDGAELSRVDLQARREGDVLGAAQSGRRKTLRVLDLLRHEDIIIAARDEATALVGDDPTLAGHPSLRQAVDTALRDADAAYLEKG